MENKEKKTGNPAVSDVQEKNQKQDQEKILEIVTLNKYLASCGVCSRRKAEELIKQGFVTVNHAVVTNPGYRVQEKDVVRYKKQEVKPEKFAYILLNKPDGYVTTVSDPHHTKTVMELIQSPALAGKRLFPVGRLDIHTTGLLLLTNDGDLAQKLAHPKHGVQKMYQASLDQPLAPDDLQKIRDGVFLEDGKVSSDRAYYITGSKRRIGIQIHTGKNRIIRRIFKHLGYNVVELDRVAYAGLSKRGLERGEWRFLKSSEVAALQKAEFKKTLEYKKTTKSSNSKRSNSSAAYARERRPVFKPRYERPDAEKKGRRPGFKPRFKK